MSQCKGVEDESLRNRIGQRERVEQRQYERAKERNP